jgi:hypothetical protein
MLLMPYGEMMLLLNGKQVCNEYLDSQPIEVSTLRPMPFGNL